MTADNVTSLLPRLPTEDEKPGANAQARAPARTREDADRPMKMNRLTIPAVSLLAGASPMYAQPLSIMGYWALHKQQADYYRRWWARYPRLLYGAWHAFVEVPLAFLWIWSGDSFAKRCGFLLVLAATAAIMWVWG